MNKKGFVGLLEILIAIAIIGALMYFMLKRYTGKPVMNKDTERTMSEQGIDTSNYKTVVDTTRAKLNETQKKQEQQFKEINDFATMPGQ